MKEGFKSPIEKTEIQEKKFLKKKTEEPIFEPAVKDSIIEN